MPRTNTKSQFRAFTVEVPTKVFQEVTEKARGRQMSRSRYVRQLVERDIAADRRQAR